MRRPSLAAVVIAIASLPAGPAPAQGPRLIDREIFFGNPDRGGVQISPDGTRLSFLAPLDGVMNVWVESIGGAEPRAVTRATQRPIRTYFWAHNAQQIVYAQDRDGDENFRLYAVDLETLEERCLTPEQGVQARVLATDPDFPDEILVGLNRRVPQIHDAFIINTRSGEERLTFQNDDGFVGLVADRTLQIRAATRFTPDGGVRGYLRAEDGAWIELARWGMADAVTSGPLGFSRDGSLLYLMDSRGRDTGRLASLRLAPAEDAWRYDALAEHGRADLGEVIFDPRTGLAQAASFDYARREWRILDEKVRPDFEALASVADGELDLISRDGADQQWIVSFVRDNGPREYYRYDRRTRRAEFLFNDRKALAGLELASMQPVIIKARDGLELVSYLSTPPQAAPGPLPMVLLVHGGPWARDTWGYNSIHQWLANRGYAVLSVNFRGSAGFGKAFINAGTREWSGRMHDDLIDAVNWAVGKGVADPQRVAIMGGSYGGYATLVGLTFTPDFFAAGVDIVGPSNVRTLLESIPPYWEPIKALFESRVGSLSEPGYLESISPLTRVDAIARPLLIGQGQNDPRVKEAESRQIVDAMQRKGLPVTYVVFPDEGHGFARPGNSLAFFAVTEAFLAQHLGGRAQEIGSAVRGSSARVEAGAALIDGLDEAAGTDGGG
jgi:dipeptidyl aminopeptidase/acylaminoacyl peptidase